MWAAVSALLLAPTARRKDNADLPPASATAYLRVETVPLQAAGQGLDLPGRAGADAGHPVHVYAPLSGRLMNFSPSLGERAKRDRRSLCCTVVT